MTIEDVRKLIKPEVQIDEVVIVYAGRKQYAAKMTGSKLVDGKARLEYTADVPAPTPRKTKEVAKAAKK